MEYIKNYENIDINPESPQDYLFCVSEEEIICKIANYEIVTNELVIIHVYKPIVLRRFMSRPSPLKQNDPSFNRFSVIPQYQELFDKIARYYEQNGHYSVIHCDYDDDVKISREKEEFDKVEQFLYKYLEFARDYEFENIKIKEPQASLIAVELLIQLKRYEI